MGTPHFVESQNPFHGSVDCGVCIGVCLAEEHRRWVAGFPASSGEADADAAAGGV